VFGYVSRPIFRSREEKGSSADALAGGDQVA